MNPTTIGNGFGEAYTAEKAAQYAAWIESMGGVIQIGPITSDDGATLYTSADEALEGARRGLLEHMKRELGIEVLADPAVGDIFGDDHGQFSVHISASRVFARDTSGKWMNDGKILWGGFLTLKVGPQGGPQG